MSLSLGVLGLASFYGPAYAGIADERTNCEVVAASTVGVDNESLAALSRPTSDQFADAYDCPVYDEVEPVLKTADAVVIATKTTRRTDDARHALDRGLPALCAKPAAKRYDDVRRLAATAATVDVPVTFTTPARYDDAVAGVADRLDNGLIGDVLAVRAGIRHDRPPEAGIEENAEHAPDEAGAAYAMTVYTADALLWLTPSHPERVTAEYVNANTPYSAHPDLGTATVRFHNGVLGTMTMTYSTDCREEWGNWEIEVVGTDGILRTAHQGYEGMYWAAGDADERYATAFGRTTSPVLDRTFDAFYRSIQGSRPERTPDADHVAAALGLCEAWRTAADEGPISLEKWPPSPGGM
jgi:UDP-N-acetyl-2-amino-2-deoxyglucuronate dehydrogenase